MPCTPVVLSRIVRLFKSAANCGPEFPWRNLKDEISKMELTEFHRVEPSPFAIKMYDDGRNEFVGPRA